MFRFWGMKPAILLLCALIVVALPACAPQAADAPDEPAEKGGRRTHPDARPDTRADPQTRSCHIPDGHLRRAHIPKLLELLRRARRLRLDRLRARRLCHGAIWLLRPTLRLGSRRCLRLPNGAQERDCRRRGVLDRRGPVEERNSLERRRGAHGRRLRFHREHSPRSPARSQLGQRRR